MPKIDADIGFNYTCLKCGKTIISPIENMGDSEVCKNCGTVYVFTEQEKSAREFTRLTFSCYENK